MFERIWKFLLPKLEFLLRWYQQLRITGLTRYAGITTLAGLGIIGMSFNDILFSLFLGPVGFDRQGLLAPITGFALVFIGLLALVADRAMAKPTNVPTEHDRRLYLRYANFLKWQALDNLLNNLHNEYIYDEELSRLVNLCEFYADVGNHFNDAKMQKNLEHLNAELVKLYLLVTSTFFTDERSLDKSTSQYKRFLFLPHISVDRTGQSHPEYFRKKKELDIALNNFETAVKEFVSAARGFGLIQIVNQNAAATK